MTQLRLVPYRRLRRVVEAVGFEWVRREGSHNIFQNQTGRIVVIPDHGTRPIGRGLLSKILRQVELTAEEHHRILDEL